MTGGYDSRCKACISKYAKSLREAHKTAPPKPDCCDVCGKTGYKLYLDHDHDTGTPRGWLCNRCNTGIGRFNESIELLQDVVDYLKRHRETIN